VKLTRKKGKLLGGEQPKTGGRWAKPARAGRPVRGRTGGGTVLGMLSFALFVLGLVGGFAWAQDRQLRGGVLRQAAEARDRPDWVQLEELPAYVSDAFVSVIEPSIVREGRLRGGRTGTSVAREVVRQVHMLPDGVGGEARALAMAPLLEQRATRRRTLEIYLNRVALGETRGHPVQGVWHAAREYFEKDPSALTLGEAATLAGLLLPPRITDPQRDAGAVGARRNEVLEVLLRGELISAEDHRRAIEEPLGFQPGLGDMPMTRPFDWGEEPDTVRLPEEIRRSLAEPDSVRAPA
jgi:hypothetical protein